MIFDINNKLTELNVSKNYYLLFLNNQAIMIRYAHTNIVARDWKRLKDFYVNVFGCTPVPPERNQSGLWLEKGTGVKGASLQGMHLRLPGYGDSGPTLEIYQYHEIKESSFSPAANNKGYGHLAFEVDDLEKVLESTIDHGGKMLGEISETHVEGVGHIYFIYISDPEDNIIELQKWVRK